MPAEMAVFIACVEFFGGIFLALGLASRITALVLTVNLTMAYVIGDREALLSFFRSGQVHCRGSLCIPAGVPDRADFLARVRSPWTRGSHLSLVRAGQAIEFGSSLIARFSSTIVLTVMKCSELVRPASSPG